MKIFNVGLMIEQQANGFQKAMRNNFDQYFELNCGIPYFNNEIIRIAREVKPDIIFLQIQTPGVLDLNIAKQLAELSFVIQWNGDIRDLTPQWGIELGNIIQLTTYSNMRDVDYTKSLGINSDFLQIGIDPERYTRHEHNNICAPEIVFMANNYENIYPMSEDRINLVNRMKTEFGNRFGIYGKGWWRANGDLMGDQILESKHYNSAKIAINQNHFNADRFTSDRIFRALGSGVMVLSHEYPNMEQDFIIGKHLDTYKNFDDLVTKCYLFLANDNIRKTIADAGYEHCHKNYTFDNMAKNIIKLYEKYK